MFTLMYRMIEYLENEEIKNHNNVRITLFKEFKVSNTGLTMGLVRLDD